jgi:hypothetical protein
MLAAAIALFAQVDIGTISASFCDSSGGGVKLYF